MQPKRTSKEPLPLFKLSTWIIIILFILYCCGIYVFCQFIRWLPRLCSPMLACSAERRVLVCTIGTSPLSTRWWFQMRARYSLLPSSCQSGLVSNGKSHLGHGSFGHGEQEVERATYECMAWQPTGKLFVFVYCNVLYLCTVMYMFVKQWRNCGWRWDK